MEVDLLLKLLDISMLWIFSLLQLSEDITGPPPVDDSSIEDGMTWIYEHLSDDCILPLSGYDQIIKEVNKEEIGNVLRMMHVQKLDVGAPLINVYLC